MRLMTNSANRKPVSESAVAPAQAEAHSFREKLAALEHEQWCNWSRTVAQTEQLSPERLESWTRGWVSYDELSEADKDLDRAWADRVLELMANAGLSANGPGSSGMRRD